MMLADLRTLHQEIGEVLRRLEALVPLVATCAAARRPQGALGAAPSDPGPIMPAPVPYRRLARLPPAMARHPSRPPDPALRSAELRPDLPDLALVWPRAEVLQRDLQTTVAARRERRQEQPRAGKRKRRRPPANPPAAPPTAAVAAQAPPPPAPEPVASLAPSERAISRAMGSPPNRRRGASCSSLCAGCLGRRRRRDRATIPSLCGAAWHPDRGAESLGHARRAATPRRRQR
jgi:hypothetical protein